MSMLAYVNIEPLGRRPIRLVAPLFLMWALVIPGVIICLPLITFECLRYRQIPAVVIWRGLTLLTSMSGTLVDIDSPEARVRVRVV